MSERSGLLKNPYVLTIGTKVAVVLFGIVNSVFINRFLGTALKGQYSYVMNYVAIISIFMSVGVYQGYSAFKKQGMTSLKQKFVQFFKLQFLINMAIVILLILVVPLENSYFFLLIPLQVMTKEMDFLCIIEDINIRNLSKIIGTTVYTLALAFVFFIVTPPHLVFIFILVVVQQVLGITIKIKLLDLRLFRLEKTTDFGLLVKAVRFGIMPLFTLLLITSNYRIDIFILKGMTEFTDIGIYSLAVNLGGQLWLIPDAFKDVLFGRNAKKNDVEGIMGAIRLNLLLSVMMILFFLMLGRPLIRLLYQDAFERAYVPLVIIITGNLFMIFYKFIYTLFISDGRRKISVMIFVLAVSVNVVLNFLLIPRFNINGAALASLVSYSLCGILFFIVFSRHYNVSVKDIIIKKSEIAHYISLIRLKVRKPND